MVKITLEYRSVDEAIVALGKLVGAPAAASPPVATSAAADGAATPAKPPRRGRSDKGQPRGPYGLAGAQQIAAQTNAGGDKSLGVAASVTTQPAVPDPSKAAEQAANSESTPAAPALATQVAPGPAPKIGEAQAAIAEVFTSKGVDAALKVLAPYGASAVRELKPDQYAAFIADCKKVMAA